MYRHTSNLHKKKKGSRIQKQSFFGLCPLSNSLILQSALGGSYASIFRQGQYLICWTPWTELILVTRVPVTGLVVAQKVRRGIALLFQDHGTRRGWVVSSTPRPYLTPGKDPVPIVQEAGWASGPVWTGGKSCPPNGIQSPDRPARSQSLHRLSYLVLVTKDQ